MELELLWYVLAGFILGFIVSTLWEWLHFRRERIKLRDQRIAELEASIEQERQSSTPNASGYDYVYPEDILPGVNPSQSYSGGGVLLETEREPGQHPEQNLGQNSQQV